MPTILSVMSSLFAYSGSLMFLRQSFVLWFVFLQCWQYFADDVEASNCSMSDGLLGGVTWLINWSSFLSFRQWYSSFMAPINCCELINFFGSYSGMSLRRPTCPSVKMSQDCRSDVDMMTLNCMSEILKLSSPMRFIRSQYCFNLFRCSSMLLPSRATVWKRFFVHVIVVWCPLQSWIASKLDQLSC
jgi:hypothetical protein